MAIETSRNTTEPEDSYPDFIEYPDVHKPVTEWTMQDQGDLLQYVKEVPFLEGDTLLLQWLYNKDIRYTVVSEHIFEADKDKYKDWKVIRIQY